MKKEEVFEKLVHIIHEVKEEEIEIKMDTLLVESEVFDSLELINYLTMIEENFDLNISLDEFIEKKLGLVEKMVDYIISNKS